MIALDLDAGDAEPVGDREAFGEEEHTHHRRAQRGADLDEDERALEPERFSRRGLESRAGRKKGPSPDMLWSGISRGGGPIGRPRA